MTTDTDTESEPESSQYQGFSSNCDLSLPDEVTPENAKAAMDALRDMALCDFRRDQHLHDKILCASNVIVAFLKNGVCPTEGRDVSPSLTTFSKLVQMSFISMLFDYRKVFHSVAAEALLPGTVTSTVVCWVDVILATLSDAVVQVAHGSRTFCDSPRDTGSEIARKQFEENALRAAAQLPYAWNDVPHVISSERSSPAAKRLALRLAFAVYIMGPQLDGCDGWLEDGIPASEMFQIVQCRFTPTPCVSMLRSHCMLDDLQQQERINDAMIISLYAASDTTRQRSELMSPFRPYSINSLLHVIQVIMRQEDSGSSTPLASPCEVLDPAQTILLGWGGVVPWCWRTRKDQRVADAGCIAHMTATWLFHFDITLRASSCGCVDDWTKCLTLEITRNPPAASSAIIRLLHHGLIALCSNQVYSISLVDVLFKACWASIRLLDPTSTGGWRDDNHAIDLCKCLCILFVVLGNSADELQAQCHILEALTFVTVDQFQVAFKAIREDTNARFTLRLDEAITTARRLMFTDNGEFSSESGNLLAAKNALDFSAILCRKDGRDRFPEQTLSTFLGSIINRLSQESPTSLPWVILCDSVLTLLAALEDTLSDRSPADQVWEEEVIWQIAIAQGHPSLPVSAAFSRYIVAASRVCDSLRCAEAWDCLRDVLLLTLSRSFVADDEPLSLLVCPSICQALLRLLQLMDAHALEFVLSSPWTISLCTDLQSVLEHEGSDEYTGILKARLETVGRALVQQISIKRKINDNEHVLPLPNLEYDFLFIPLHPFHKLIMVPSKML